MVLRCLFFSSLLLSLFVEADVERTTLGEIKTPEYFGNYLSDTYYNRYLFQLKLEDDLLRDNYVELQLNEEFIGLSKFVTEELYLGVSCPDSSFVEKSEYIRFLNRLQVMSYLFQSLREHEYASKQLGSETNCAVKWETFIKECSPKTTDMKRFLKNASYPLNHLTNISVPFEKSSRSSIQRWYEEANSDGMKSLTQIQVSNLADRRVSSNNSAFYLNRVCDREVELFKKVCSEEDSLHGMSHIPEVYQLITSSMGLRAIDKDGTGAGCVKRYTLQNRNLEKRLDWLEDLFSVLYEHNLTARPQNPQGQLFILGAMKEYSDKGLEDLFTPDLEPEEKIEPKVVKKRITNPVFETIKLPKFVKKKKLKKVRQKEPAKLVEKVLPKKSSFLISCEVRKQFNLELVNIDMEKFRSDYVFTLSEKEKLLPIVERFSTVKALRSMKKLDKLGMIDAPMPLKFLKFLIEEKMNQNLFNLNLVLGEKFFVKNDIDNGVEEPIYIRLFFDASNKSLWQLQVLAPPN